MSETVDFCKQTTNLYCPSMRDHCRSTKSNKNLSITYQMRNSGEQKT